LVKKKKYFFQNAIGEIVQVGFHQDEVMLEKYEVDVQFLKLKVKKKKILFEIQKNFLGRIK
jgi:hypothetical protein